jgi:hypothetical protein
MRALPGVAAALVAVGLVVACGSPPSPLVEPQRPEKSRRHAVAQAVPAAAPARAPACLADVTEADLATDRRLAPDEALYARASEHLLAHRYAPAAALFRRVAMEQAPGEAGISATKLYLESLHALGTRAPRPQCFDDMQRDVPTFLTLYCRDPERPQVLDLCTALSDIEADIERLAAQRWLERGDMTGDASAFREGGELHLQLFLRRCDSTTPRAARCDEIGFNAAMAFKAGGREDLAREVLALMRTPKYGVAESELTTRLGCRLVVERDSGACLPGKR